eukprot:GHVP01010741.1.p2 GENE.GHVP01010741.1~~GHVP01010741.1.p2  ORF type:complete len:266 (-),score=53.79 GHVP01010741.1:1034-1831(-)
MCFGNASFGTPVCYHCFLKGTDTSSSNIWMIRNLQKAIECEKKEIENLETQKKDIFSRVVKFPKIPPEAQPISISGTVEGISRNLRATETKLAAHYLRIIESILEPIDLQMQTQIKNQTFSCPSYSYKANMLVSTVLPRLLAEFLDVKESFDCILKTSFLSSSFFPDRKSKSAQDQRKTFQELPEEILCDAPICNLVAVSQFDMVIRCVVERTPISQRVVHSGNHLSKKHDERIRCFAPSLAAERGCFWEDTDLDACPLRKVYRL